MREMIFAKTELLPAYIELKDIHFERDLDHYLIETCLEEETEISLISLQIESSGSYGQIELQNDTLIRIPMKESSIDSYFRKGFKTARRDGLNEVIRVLKSYDA